MFFFDKLLQHPIFNSKDFYLFAYCYSVEISILFQVHLFFHYLSFLENWLINLTFCKKIINNGRD
jgi:hypothetical protein